MTVDGVTDAVSDLVLPAELLVYCW